MTDAIKFSKRLTSDTDEVIIRAQVADADGGAFRPVTFDKSRIDYITEVEPGISGIVLKTGAKIAVALAYEDLERKIYFSDAREEPVLDFRALTGEAVKDKRVPDVATDFAAAAPKKPVDPQSRPMIDKPLKIAIFVRQSEQQNFQMYFVMDTNIDWSGVEGLSNGKNGPATKIPLRFGKGPFGESAVMFDMPRAAFMEAYNTAKLEGREELDLREWTRRRDPDKTPAPARRPELG